MIEELGSGAVSKDTAACWIEIREIPDNVEYEIIRDSDAGFEKIIYSENDKDGKKYLFVV